ncbi:MAG TPA: thiamine pyrophosphate-binding protein [Bryobacteraceae bacterium]|nr:thiamine pyrophosphate-binding protein [Bryobacteraceae bacterium]
MATVAECFVEDLRRRGVEWVAALAGNGLEPILEAAQRAGLLLVDARNEQTVSYLAEAYGRLTRSPGVCLVSSGMGHVNALSGVAAAWFGSTPLVLVSGAGELRTAGLGHYQDMDQAAVAAPLTRFSRVVAPAERWREIVDEAFAYASGPPPGPVHITFPADVQRSEVAPEGAVAPVPRAPAAAPADDVEETARLLAASERPLIVAGSGMYYAGSGPAFLDFIEEFPMPVVTPIWDRGVIDAPLRAFMGVIGASSGGPRLLADADCIIMAGAEPDYRVGFLQPGAVREDAAVAYFTSAWAELRDDFEHARVWQDRRSPEEQERSAARDRWLEEAVRRRDEFRRAVEARGLEQAGAGVHAIHIVRALREVLPEGACLLIDGGNIGQWAHHLLADRYPGNWLTNGPGGAVGWGIGGALGARLAFPEGPVVLLSGDGAFTFNVADLESAVRQRLHFVAVVADDQGWGILDSGLGPIDFAALARSLGARGITIRRPGEIRPALERALGERAVTVIHVPVTGGAPG